MKSFEHRICSVIYDRVGSVNGEWQGDEELAGSLDGMDSCPMTAEYLDEAALEGWQLVTAVPSVLWAKGKGDKPKKVRCHILYLRRECEVPSIEELFGEGGQPPSSQ